MNNKVPLNLHVSRELKRAIKVQCAKDDMNISALTEQLYAQFLAGELKIDEKIYEKIVAIKAERPSESPKSKRRKIR